MRRILLACALGLIALPVHAQQTPGQGPPEQELPPGHPPTGPAGVFQQAGEARQQQQQQERDQRAMPADDVHRGLGGGGQQAQAAVAQPSAELPPGTVRVTVVDPDGSPATGQVVDLGVLAQGGNRERHDGTTGPDGVAVFRGLPTGTAQAYRVNVPYAGATYSTTPFQLPPDRGYVARVTRQPSTRDERGVLAMLSRAFLELRDTRLHVIQQVQLANLGSETYLFPQDGKRVTLPDGFTAFQSQEVMTDQRLQPTVEGFKVYGSLPPGQVTLVWAYDLPLETGKMAFDLPLPWRTFNARVETDAPPGLDMSVRGMPAPDLHEVGGHRLLFTQKQYGPQDPPPSTLLVQLSGVPGPGPLRWIALGAALVFLFGGLLFIFRTGAGSGVTAEALARRRAHLLGEAANVEQLFAREEIGPKYRQRQMDAIVAELASVLRQQEAANVTSERAEAGKKGRG